IEPIALSNAQNQELDKIMKSEKGTLYKHYKLRKIMMNNTGSAGGRCTNCRQLPTHIVKYHVKHCVLVQKYCESCLKKEGLIV
ncbi:MAG: hypothetical protein WB511_00230, partial [Nitrososphaeraceae archaeon]